MAGFNIELDNARKLGCGNAGYQSHRALLGSRNAQDGGHRPDSTVGALRLTSNAAYTFSGLGTLFVDLRLSAEAAALTRIVNPLALMGYTALFVNTNATVQVEGPITSGTISKTGKGQLILSGNNTYPQRHHRSGRHPDHRIPRILRHALCNSGQPRPAVGYLPLHRIRNHARQRTDGGIRYG